MNDTFSEARARVAHAVSGMVAGGYAIDFDLASGALPCSRCGDPLSAGDEVTVALSYYESHTWEPYGVYCRDHGVDSVAESMGAATDEQAVVEATLEPTGYHDPVGDHHPNAVSLGGVSVLDYEPLRYDQ